MIVTKQRDEAFEPDTGTIWVDGSGVVYFLHRSRAVTASFTVYQMTRLENGEVRGTSPDKTDLVEGMCLCSCPVTIQNG